MHNKFSESSSKLAANFFSLLTHLYLSKVSFVHTSFSTLSLTQFLFFFYYIVKEKFRVEKTIFSSLKEFNDVYQNEEENWTSTLNMPAVAVVRNFSIRNVLENIS